MAISMSGCATNVWAPVQRAIAARPMMSKALCLNRCTCCIHVCIGAGAEAVGSDSMVSGVLGLLRRPLVFFQCCLYVSCSSWRRPWWLLALAFLADCHCRRLAFCRLVSATAACVLAFDDVTLHGCWHAANVMAALVAPLFAPKKSKRGSNFQTQNRRQVQTDTEGEAFAGRPMASQESGWNSQFICVCVRFAFMLRVWFVGVGGCGGDEGSRGSAPTSSRAVGVRTRAGSRAAGEVAVQPSPLRAPP